MIIESSCLLVQVQCVRAANLSTKSTILSSWVRQCLSLVYVQDALDPWNFNENCIIGVQFSEFVIMNIAT